MANNGVRRRSATGHRHGRESTMTAGDSSPKAIGTIPAVRPLSETDSGTLETESLKKRRTYS